MPRVLRLAISISVLCLVGCNNSPSPTVTPKPEQATTASNQAGKNAKPSEDKGKPETKPADVPKGSTAPSAGDNPPTKAQILADVQKRIADEQSAPPGKSNESKPNETKPDESKPR